MSDDDCPRCGAGPLAEDGGSCRACGWDAELQGAHYRAEDTELPPDDEDYEDFLRREGLGGRGGASPVVVGVVALIVIALLAAAALR
ncbi:MAG: hypothetical protein AB7N76_25630 [Planctomycetota bacterium]